MSITHTENLTQKWASHRATVIPGPTNHSFSLTLACPDSLRQPGWGMEIGGQRRGEGANPCGFAVLAVSPDSSNWLQCQPHFTLPEPASLWTARGMSSWAAPSPPRNGSLFHRLFSTLWLRSGLLLPELNPSYTGCGSDPLDSDLLPLYPSS